MDGYARKYDAHISGIVCCVLTLVLGYTQPLLAQGSLNRLRSDARAPRPEYHEPVKTRDDDEDNDSESDGFVSKLINSLFFDDDDDSSHVEQNDSDSNDVGGAVFLLAAGASSPWWVPIAISGDDYSLPAYDLPFPYVDSADGYLTYNALTYYFPEWSLRTQVDYGTDLENLSFISSRALLETVWRVGIDSEFRYWHEELGSNTDQLWTGDANLVFRFARSETLQMRTGIGCNWLADEIGSDFGFNFTYGGDWFPHQPWIVSAEFDWGTLSNSELFHARATLGANVYPLETYTGFDYFDTTSLRVGSWIAGLRVWF